MASKKVCAFCPETAKLTAEHLFSDWIGRLLSPTSGRYVFRQKASPTDPGTHWMGADLNMRVRAVCGHCNNGWMSELENEARHTLRDVILHAAPVTFLPLGMVSIATFALKNAFIGDYMRDDGRSPFFSAGARRRFATNLDIPQGVQIWLGAVEGKPRVRHGIFKSRCGEPAVESVNGVEVYIFTYAVEALLLQVLAARWMNLARTGVSFPNVIPPRLFGDVALSLWPAKFISITWPPGRHLPYDSQEAFANRFENCHLELLG